MINCIINFKITQPLQAAFKGTEVAFDCHSISKGNRKLLSAQLFFVPFANTE